MASNPRLGDEKPPKEGDSKETIEKYEKAKESVRSGKATDGDRHTISEWDWDHQPGGDQRR